jgi:hypothetical protein
MLGSVSPMWKPSDLNGYSRICCNNFSRAILTLQDGFGTWSILTIPKALSQPVLGMVALQRRTKLEKAQTSLHTNRLYSILKISRISSAPTPNFLLSLEVSTKEGQALAEELGCIFIESSATDHANLQVLWHHFLSIIRQYQVNVGRKMRT